MISYILNTEIKMHFTVKANHVTASVYVIVTMQQKQHNHKVTCKWLVYLDGHHYHSSVVDDTKSLHVCVFINSQWNMFMDIENIAIYHRTKMTLRMEEK